MATFGCMKRMKCAGISRYDISYYSKLDDCRFIAGMDGL
jgi:hypothetical protein